MRQKLRRILLLSIALALLVPSPLLAVSNFYSDSNIQFYDPNACDPNGGNSAEGTSPTASVPITGGVPFDAGMSIDTDGVGSAHGDPDHQSQTSYANGKLNADTTNFIALAPGWAAAHNLKLGDVAVVQYKGKTAFAVYGDNYSGDQVHGEGSLHLAIALGITDASHPNSSKADSGVHYTVFPGTYNQMNGSSDQSKIDRIGAQASGAVAVTPGSSDGTTTCCPNNDGGTQLTGSENQEKAYNFFISKGLTSVQAGAIVGNLVAESGVNPGSQESGGSGKRPVNGVGFGIAQWTFTARQAPLLAYANKINKPVTSMEAQLGFLWQELETGTGLPNPGALESLKKITDISAATEDFMLKFEAPNLALAHLDARIAAAKAAVIKYGNGSTSPTPADGTTDTSSNVCCPTGAASGSGVTDGSPSDWVKMYTGSNRKKVDTMARGKISPKILVIHYTEGDLAGQGLLDFFATGEGQPNGIQFNVDKAGKIYQYYPLNDMQKTNHVGQANNKSIGIEISGRDVTELMGNDKQFSSVSSLAKFLCDKYDIPCSEPKGDITNDGLAEAQGMLGHDETPTNDHNDPDGKYGQDITRTDSSKHPYMVKLRTALGFNPTPGKSTGPSGTGAVTSSGAANAQCTQDDGSGGNGTSKDHVGDGPNRSLALEAVKYDTDASNGKYTYEMGGLHGALSQLEKFSKDGGTTDCTGFVRYVIWRVYGRDIGSWVAPTVPLTYFKKISASEVAAGDIGVVSQGHVDFITENKGGGKLHQFGAHSTANDLYGGDITADNYDTGFYRYTGPKGSGGGD